MPEGERDTIIMAVNASLRSALHSGTASGQDETEVTDLDPFSSHMGPVWDVAFSIVLALIILCGSIINMVVFWTLVKFRRHNYSTMDYFILSLATSDTLVLLTCYPLTLISTIAHKWVFHATGCVINGFLGFFFSFMDVGILCIMSVVRMIIVKMPYCGLVKRKSCTGALLLGVFLYALVFSLCPIFGWGEYSTEPFGTSCTINWTLPDKSYVTTVFVVVLVVPLLIMTGSYFSIVSHMKSNTTMLARHSTTRKRRNVKQKKLIRMTVIMCVCFLLTWTPYAVVSICFAYVPGFYLNPVLSAIPTMLAKVSHIINPIVYFATNSSYRSRLHQFWSKKISKSLDQRTTKGTITEGFERSGKNSISSTATSHQPPPSPLPSASIPLVPFCTETTMTSVVDNPQDSPIYTRQALLWLSNTEMGDVLI